MGRLEDDEEVGITPEEAMKQFDAILTKHSGDSEAISSEAESLMCDILRECGYGEFVDKVRKAEEWY